MESCSEYTLLNFVPSLFVPWSSARKTASAGEALAVAADRVCVDEGWPQSELKAQRDEKKSKMWGVDLEGNNKDLVAISCEKRVSLATFTPRHIHDNWS